MSLEIESKYRLSDRGESLKDQLAGMLAESMSGYVVTDTYLRHPSRDFAKTGEAFRIRREKDSVCLTYKGPKQPGKGVKTREEIEIGLADGPEAGQQALAMFTNMGFTEVLTIEKFREPYLITFQGVQVTLVVDDARELGCFVEVELVVDAESGISEAQRIIQELSQALGLKDYEPRSYLRMWLERLQLMI